VKKTITEPNYINIPDIMQYSEYIKEQLYIYFEYEIKHSKYENLKKIKDDIKILINDYKFRNYYEGN
jgi:hypothetical protein